MLKDCATCRFENNKGNNLYPCNRCIRGNFSSSAFPDQWYPFDQRVFANPNEHRISDYGELPEDSDKLLRPQPSPSLWDHQVGGSHYKSYVIQPFEFFFKNSIPHHKAAVIRRILRYDHPSGKGREDLEKIKHEIDLILDLWESPK